MPLPLVEKVVSKAARRTGEEEAAGEESCREKSHKERSCCVNLPWCPCRSCLRGSETVETVAFQGKGNQFYLKM